MELKWIFLWWHFLLAYITSKPVLCEEDIPGLRPMVNITVSCLTNCSCIMRHDVIITADCSSRHLHAVPEDLPSTLTKLILSRNSIKYLQNASFVNLPHLTDLDLSNNLIESLKLQADGLTDYFHTTPRNSEKSLSSNEDSVTKFQIVTYSSTERRSQTHLQDLTYLNKMSPLGSLKQLKILNLRLNLISDIHSGLFSYNKHLEVLDLSGNRIRELSSHAFSGLSSLRSLYLNNNSITYQEGTIADDAFAVLSSLRELNLQTNQPYRGPFNSTFTYPDRALSRLGNLQILRMDSLAVQFPLGTGFQALKNLTVLDMSNTYDDSRPGIEFCFMPDIPEKHFQNISPNAPLTVLLNGCGIVSIHPRTFSYLPNLHSLSLKDNRHIQFHGFLNLSSSFPETSIKHLDITKIQGTDFMTDLTGKYFIHLAKTSLETLIMDMDSILVIEPDVLLQLHHVNLKYLSIGDNKIIKGDFLAILGALNKLETFNISLQNRVHFSAGRREMEHGESIDDKEQRTYIVNLDSEISVAKNKTVSEYETNPVSKTNKEIASETSRNVPSSDKTTAILTIDDFIMMQQKFCPSGLRMDGRMLRHLRQNASFSVPWSNQLQDMYNIMKGNNSEVSSYIDIAQTLKADPHIPSWPATLKKVYMKHLKLGTYLPMAIFPTPNTVELVDSSSNFLWCIDGPIKNLKKLRVVNLSKNYCLALSQYFFQDMISLRSLDLSTNILGPSLQMDKDGRTFSTLTKLQHIDLSFNNIWTLHGNIFQNNSRLMSIVLRNNSLTHFSPEIGHMQHLQFLDLSHNNLQDLTDKTRSDVDTISKISLLTIDLRDNRLECTCRTLSFLIWFSQNKATFFHQDLYTCVHENGSMVYMKELEKFLHPLMRECIGPFTLSVALVVSLIILTSWIGFGVAYYFRDFYKGKLYFYYYVNYKQFFQNFLHPEQHGVKDVFVSYDDQDPHWRRFAWNVLRPRLHCRGVTTHFPEVDGFGVDGQEPAAGRSTRDVIEDSVLKGHKTLVLLTKEFFDLDDKEMKLTMAKVSEDMRETPVVIFVKFENIPVQKIPRHLRLYIQGHRILPYRGDHDHFWDELVQIIRS